MRMWVGLLGVKEGNIGFLAIKVDIQMGFTGRSRREN